MPAIDGVTISTKCGSPMTDIIAGLLCALGVLAALNERHATGRGQRIDTSLLEAGVNVHPGPDALVNAQDKLVMRAAIDRLELPNPRWASVADVAELIQHPNIAHALRFEELGDGAELRSPMAVTVISGLVASTVLTLLIIPSVYVVLDRSVEGVLRRTGTAKATGARS